MVSEPEGTSDKFDESKSHGVRTCGNSDKFDESMSHGVRIRGDLSKKRN
jgi:hypothetical protein